ncbi:MAG TPA: hypothetical protein VF170_06230, partial [Planctomycetaceae bacterium]
MGKTGFAARTAAATAALLALLLAAATAAPAAVFELSGDARAEKPDIAVAEDGTAHLAWNISVGIPGDDQLLYCRVPRGGRACAATRLIALPKIDFDGPHILLTRSGDVVLISKRCCFPGAPVFAVTSTDGGGSFGPPVQIADEFSGGSEWEVELGPGDFSVALSGGNSGPDYAAIWGAAPLDGSDLDPKTELATFPKAYFNTTGFPSPTSPIAAYSDLENVYMRAWDGSGDYNDASNWTPEAYVATGSEPKLVSGPRGVFLIYHGSKAPFQYLVRRFDGSGFPAKTQRVVSDPGTRQSAIFRDFLEDGGGKLHAVFRQRSEKGAWGLRHRVSGDGGLGWGAIETLAAGAAADDLFNLRVGAAPDGGGGIVGDHNGEGPIWFAPFRGRGGSGSCAATVKLGKAVARALTGCFQKAGKLRVATGAVKVNGVDIEPGGGANASASAAFKVIASPGQRTLKTSGKATVRVGEVVLEKGPVAWRLPPGNGKVVRLNSPDGSVFRDLGKYAKRLFDFPVDGDAELLIAGKGARVPANLRMPGLIGGVTGLTTLRTDQAGQVLAGMKIDVPNAAIGLLRIAGIDVTYDGADRFTGTAKIKLPPAYSDGIAKASVTFGFEDGELSVVEVAPPPFNPTLPIVGSPPTPIVGLDRVSLSYLRQPSSRLFQGTLFLIAGPKLFGLQVADLKGTLGIEFPSTGPTLLKAKGDLSVVRLPVANAFATYTVGLPGTLDFGGTYKIAFLSGGLKGFVDLGSGFFAASGSAAAGPFGGVAVLSSKGFGACVSVPLAPDPGMRWDWGDAFPEFVCPDLGSFGAGSSAARAAATGVTIPAGQSEAAIAVDGAGGAPEVVVSGPGGETVSGGDSVVEAGRFRVT